MDRKERTALSRASTGVQWKKSWRVFLSAIYFTIFYKSQFVLHTAQTNEIDHTRCKAKSAYILTSHYWTQVPQLSGGMVGPYPTTRAPFRSVHRQKSSRTNERNLLMPCGLVRLTAIVTLMIASFSELGTGSHQYRNYFKPHLRYTNCIT